MLLVGALGRAHDQPVMMSIYAGVMSIYIDTIFAHSIRAID